MISTQVETFGSEWLGAAATPEGRRLCAGGTTTLLATFETLASPQAAALMDALEQSALDALELLSTPEARRGVAATRAASRALVDLLNSAHTKAALAEHVDNVIENLRAHHAKRAADGRGAAAADDPGVASRRVRLGDSAPFAPPPPHHKKPSTVFENLSECSSDDDDATAAAAAAGDDGGGGGDGEAPDDGDDPLANPVDALRGLLAQAREEARRARDRATHAAPATLPKRRLSGPAVLCLAAAAAVVLFFALVGALVCVKVSFDFLFPRLSKTYEILMGHDEL